MVGEPTVGLGGPAPLYRYVRRLRNIGAALEDAAGLGDAGRRQGAGDGEGQRGALLQARAGSSGRLVVVTGGLGALGAGVVEMMLAEAHDVRVLIVGRRCEAAACAELQRRGWAGGASRVCYAQVALGGGADADEALLAALQAGTADGRALAAVLHLAGGYERAPLDQLCANGLRTATAAKVAGAVQLWRACRRIGARPAYIHFGSTASVFAGAGLGAYAGANAALEWVAGWQREQGEDARVLVWTSWGAGISQRDRSLSFARWVSPLTLPQGVRILKALLGRASEGETSLAQASHPDVLVGVNLREPSIGALFCDGPLRMLTDCLLHAAEQVPSPAQCEGRVVVCVRQWPRRRLPHMEDEGIDVEALQSLPLAVLRGEKETEPPRAGTEEGVAAIWADVLGQPPDTLDRGLNFFDAGGSSILWMRAVSRINKAFGLTLAPMLIFDQAVLSDLASHIDTLKAGGGGGGGGGWQPSACVELLAGEDGATGPVVVMLPGATGTALSFRNLLARFPPPPGVAVLGVRDPALAGKVSARI